MPSVWSKIDIGLATLFADYLKLRDGRLPPSARVHDAAKAGRVSVSVYFTGELANLEARGFQPSWRQDEHRVTGEIALSDLERLAADDGVQRIVFGTKGRACLDRSVPNIRANQVWTRTNGHFSGVTGAGAIVGVIDTGIDYGHSFFLTTDSSPENPKTRIRRIWDMGLEPDKKYNEKSPDPDLLSGGPVTFGVEYTDADINAVLSHPGVAKPVRHRDCAGHGTHVASIAAGNGHPDCSYVGVAPEADLIVVKHLFLEKDPPGVPDEKQFCDAVCYIVNSAQTLDGPPGKPVAINCSFTNSIGAHDGRTTNEDWLARTFATTPGAVVVVAAGNEAGDCQHAEIAFPPAGGWAVIPLDLYDDRTYRGNFDKCRPDADDDVWLAVWYPHSATTLLAEFALPTTQPKPSYTVGPRLYDTIQPTTIPHAGCHYDMFHSPAPSTQMDHSVVQRNVFQLRVTTHVDTYQTKRHWLRLNASGKLTAHLWCNYVTHGFKVGTPEPGPKVAVSVIDQALIGEYAGAANVITVAAYNAEATNDPVASFSSRGPLVSYEQPPSPEQPQEPAPPAKPELAAPGCDIDAAKSSQAQPPWPGSTTPHSGTSLSAPHVTGTVALMLAKNPGLTTAQVIDVLTHYGVRPAALPEDPNAVGAGRLDAKAAVDNTPSGP